MFPGLTAPYPWPYLACMGTQCGQLKLAIQAAHFADVILVRQIMEKYARQRPHHPDDEQNFVTVCSKGNEFIRQLFVVFFLLTSFQTIQKQGYAMDMHALAGIAVLLILAAVSAYRDALRNDPMSKLNASGIRFPHSDDQE